MLAAPATWTASAPPAIAVRAAFACLPSADQRLVAALLFDGERIAALAARLGVPAGDLRARASSAMHHLHRALRRAASPSALSGLLTLRALDALDADEAARLAAIIGRQPSA